MMTYFSIEQYEEDLNNNDDYWSKLSYWDWLEDVLISNREYEQSRNEIHMMEESKDKLY